MFEFAIFVKYSINYNYDILVIEGGVRIYNFCKFFNESGNKNFLFKYNLIKI